MIRRSTQSRTQRQAPVRMQRRGQAEMVEWFPRIIMMIVAVVVIAFLVITYTQRDVSAPELGRAAYLYRLYYSDIIMQKDAVTGRVYPGIVDMAKLKDSALDSVFAERDAAAPQDAPARIASMLHAVPAAGCAGITETTAYNNKQTYLLYAPGVGIPGSSTTEKVAYPVTLKSGELACAGTLEITIARPGS